MRVNTRRVGSNEVQSVWVSGKEYLKFPMIAATEMVMNYPEWDRSEYLPASEIEASASRWNGIPLVPEHPDTQSEDIGLFVNPETLDNGEKLRGEGVIDVEKAESIGGLAERVVTDLRANNELEVSAGYKLGETGRQGRHNGEFYDLEQRGLQPDHIAIFPKGEFTARCSPQDGCAAPRVNCIDENCTCDSTMTENDNRQNTTGYGGSRLAWDARNPEQASYPENKRNNYRRKANRSREEREREQRKRTNYGAIPGPIDTDGESEYPNGRENYEERKNAGETGPSVQNPESRKTPSWEKDAVIED